MIGSCLIRNSLYDVLYDLAGNQMNVGLSVLGKLQKLSDCVFLCKNDVCADVSNSSADKCGICSVET